MPIEDSWRYFVETPYHGVAWYRCVVDVPDFPKTWDRVYLDFHGVDEEAWVWLNGEYIGSHAIGPDGWDDPFQLDITGKVRPGEPNHLAVRAKNTRGDGGIWKPVCLRVLDTSRCNSSPPG